MRKVKRMRMTDLRRRSFIWVCTMMRTVEQYFFICTEGRLEIDQTIKNKSRGIALRNQRVNSL